MAVSAHHTPTPSPAIWPRFSVPRPLIAGFSLSLFFSLFVFYFYFYSNARKASRWKKSCMEKRGCWSWVSGRRAKGHLPWKLGQSWWGHGVRCFAKPWGAKIQPPVCGNPAQLLADSRLRGVDGGQDLTWDFLKIGAESLVVVRCLLSRHEVYFSRKRTIELQNWPHGRVWNWSGICRVCTPCRFFKSQELPSPFG